MQRPKDTPTETSAGIDISVFLGTASLFFVGILIAKLSDLNSQIRVGILFLIVATFAFIFSAIIYANVSGADEDRDAEKRSFFAVGNAISEFLGLYVFVVAIPLVVTALTDDHFMQLSALIITLVSIVSYTISPFSMANRVLSRGSQIAYSVILMVLVASLTVGQIYTESIFIPLAIGVILFFSASALAFVKLSKQSD